MPQLRFSVLLPSKGDRQVSAAKQVLEALRGRFAGGTWFSQSHLTPVVWGWWMSKDSADGAGDVSEAPPKARELDVDPHILVMVDKECDDPLTSAEGNVDRIVDCFRAAYKGKGVEQKRIYVFCQEIAVHDRPGRKAAREGSRR